MNMCHLPLIAVVCATLLSFQPALAQFSQQGPKLVGTGAVGMAGQGSSVSLSADGDTGIVGGAGDDGLSGAAWVWTRSGPSPLMVTRPSLEGASTTLNLGPRGYGRGAEDCGPNRAPSLSAQAPSAPVGKAFP